MEPEVKVVETQEQVVAKASTETVEKEAKETIVQKLMKSLFGDETKAPEGEAKTAETKTEEKKATTTEIKKTYTEDEFVAEKAKWEAAKAEQERLAKLPADERKAEEEKSRDLKIKELESKLLKNDLKTDAIKSMDDEGYPVKLAELVDYSSKEAMQSSLQAVQDTFKACVEEALKEKLKGTTPAGLGNASKSENQVRDQIASAIKGGM